MRTVSKEAPGSPPCCYAPSLPMGCPWGFLPELSWSCPVIWFPTQIKQVCVGVCVCVCRERRKSDHFSPTKGSPQGPTSESFLTPSLHQCLPFPPSPSKFHPSLSPRKPSPTTPAPRDLLLWLSPARWRGPFWPLSTCWDRVLFELSLSIQPGSS